MNWLKKTRIFRNGYLQGTDDALNIVGKFLMDMTAEQEKELADKLNEAIHKACAEFVKKEND